MKVESLQASIQQETHKHFSPEIEKKEVIVICLDLYFKSRAKPIMASH